jgi:orotidine-5'-phosphate decarboxylase
VSTEAHAADRLLAAIARCRAPVCIGLDPVAERLPAALHVDGADPQRSLGAIMAFAEEVVQAVAPHVPCIKLQSACFERYRDSGVRCLYRLIELARRLGLEVILDWKRGDIGLSADHYAAAAFEPSSPTVRDDCPDWVTVNSYLGEDGLAPFLRPGFGAFALVRTSNPGGDVIQRQQLTDGRTVAELVAQMVARSGSRFVGTRGYSSLGAVVGATKAAEAARLRELMPQQIFLVPGYGAQGGCVADVLPCFHPHGVGAIVTASRSVIYAFEPEASDWANAVERAARAFAEEIGRAVGLR